MTENVNKKYFGPQALGEVVRRLLGFNSRIESAERTVADCAMAESQRVEAEKRRMVEFGRLIEVVAEQSEAVAALAGVRDALASSSRMEAAVTDNERQRQAEEVSRQSEEECRKTAEQTRIGSETCRTDAEKSRVDAEITRGTAEESRSRAEEDRNRAELAREKAEERRMEEFAVITSDPVAKMRLLCDLISAAVGSFGYARITDGEFDCEVNGLKLTYEEGVEVYNAGKIQGYYGQEWYARNDRIRTNLPCTGTFSWAEMTKAFLQCYNLEVGNMQNARLAADTFAYCHKLRRVIGSCQSSQNMSGCFYRCFLLEEIDNLTIKHNVDLNLSDSPLLNLPSFLRIVANASNTSAITITVHPDVYAKFTDEYNSEWHQVLMAAAEKKIVFATV